MQSANQVELCAHLGPGGRTVTAHVVDRFVERNRQRHQHRDRRRPGSPDPRRTVDDQPSPRHHTVDDLGQDRGEVLERRCMEVVDRIPQRPLRWLRSQPGHVVGVSIDELVLLVEAHHTISPDTRHQSLGVGTDRVLSAEPEPAGRRRRQRDLVDAAVGVHRCTTIGPECRNQRAVSSCPYAGGVIQLAGRLRVVMIVIDAMPHRHVSPSLTPHLWRQASTGGRAPMGALSLPVSVTYANHAAFVTGADPAVTGVHGNHTWIDGRGWVPSPKEGPMATTLFDRVGDAGGTSVMVAGDQKLVAQMGGGRADVSWPPDGRLPEGTGRCAFGYASDAAVLSALDGTDLGVDFALIHLNEPDTTSHLHGPDSAEALDQYRATDAAYGEVVARLSDGWDHTLVLTVSDHDQETITDFTPVELAELFDDVDGVEVANEGTAALVHRGSSR